MQATQATLDVKLMLQVPGNRTPIAKRIPAKCTFDELVTKAKALAAKHDMLDEGRDPAISYKDEDEWANLDVEDNDDLELAVAKAMTSQAKSLTFFIKTSKSVAEKRSKRKKCEDEEMKGDSDEVPVKGKKNKEKNAKMPRKALKALINAEFDKQSKAIFNEMLRMKNLDGVEQREKTPAELAQELVEHTGVECDGCGVNPIVGERFKCGTCKNFDYCSNCEERLDHKHAFLKIKEAGGAPSFLCTILDGEEAEKTEGSDFENLVQQFASKFARGGHKMRGGRGGCRGGGRGGFNFQKMLHCFAEKMGMDPSEMKGKDIGKAFADMDFQNQFGGQFGGCGNQAWKHKRAVIVKKPEGIIEAIPGEVIISEIEVLNDTFWPWKPGCQITLDDHQTEDVLPIEVFNIPIEKEVKGKQQETIEFPLTIPEHIVAGDKVYEIFLTFRGPKGNAFGERIPLKIKIALPKVQVTEADVYKLAIKFHENGCGTIEECAQVCKQNNCDEAACTMAFSKMKTSEQ